MLVNYHSRIGGLPTKTARVTGAPRLLGGHTWVCDIENHSGCVALDALTQLEDEPAWPRFVPAGEHTVTVTARIRANSPEEAATSMLSYLRKSGQLLVLSVTDPAGRERQILEVSIALDEVRGPVAGMVSSSEILASPGTRLDASFHLANRKR
jgi:hypothetical protein